MEDEDRIVVSESRRWGQW